MLVDRAQGGLTDEGARVVERARRVLRELDDIAADVAHVDGFVTGDVRLGMLGTTARWMLARLLSALAVGPPPRAGDRVRGQHVGAAAGPPRWPLQRRHHPPADRRAGAGHRAAVRRGPPAARPRRPPAGRAGRAAARRARRAPPAAATGRVGAAPGARPGRQLRRRAARRPGRDRRGPPARHASPSTATARRSSPPRPRPRAGTAMCARVRVPELPPRVVALAYHRRPPPGAPARALFDVLRDVLAARASDQPGVRLGTDAFPLSRPFGLSSLSRSPSRSSRAARPDRTTPGRRRAAGSSPSRSGSRQDRRPTTTSPWRRRRACGTCPC